MISKEALSFLLEDSVVYHHRKSQPLPPNKRQRVPSPPNSLSEEDDASVESTPRKVKKRAKEKDSVYRPQGMIGNNTSVSGLEAKYERRLVDENDRITVLAVAHEPNALENSI